MSRWPVSPPGRPWVAGGPTRGRRGRSGRRAGRRWAGRAGGAAARPARRAGRRGGSRCGRGARGRVDAARGDRARHGHPGRHALPAHRRLDHSGTVVGSLSAAGTLGSLAGTFLTGFVLVALLPMTAILLARRRRLPGPGAGRRPLPAPRRGGDGRRRGGGGRSARRRARAVRRRHRLLLRPGRGRPAAPHRAGPRPRRPAPLLRRPGRPAPPGVRLRPPLRRRRRHRLRLQAPGSTPFTWAGAASPCRGGSPRPGPAARRRSWRSIGAWSTSGTASWGSVRSPEIDVRVGDARTTLRGLARLVGRPRRRRRVRGALGAVAPRDDGVRRRRPARAAARRRLPAERDRQRPAGAGRRRRSRTLAARFPHVAVLARPDQLERGGGGNFVLVAADRAARPSPRCRNAWPGSASPRWCSTRRRREPWPVRRGP